MTKEIDLPNGPVSAALLGGGIGSAIFGIVTLADILNKSVAKALTWSKPVGDLSGKSIIGIVAFFVSWAILHFIWKGKETNFSKISTLAIALLVVGLILTFPPVWKLFGAG